jgi:hypothetical protein
MAVINQSWESHDFRVKMLDWSAARGSRLAYTCRRCGRNFCHFAVPSQGPWAVDREGRALEMIVSNRWLSQECPRLFNATDDDDRKQLSKRIAQ